MVVADTVVESVEVCVERVVVVVTVTTVDAVEVCVWVMVEVLVEKSVGYLNGLSVWNIHRAWGDSAPEE
jgi:hypothetical protein